MKKTISYILLAFCLLLVFSACNRKEPGNKDVTTVSTTLGSETEQPPEGETSVTVVAPLGDETTTDHYEFSGKQASLIGTMLSEIYGNVRVYYEKNHFALMDEFNSVILTMSAENYAPHSVALKEDEKAVVDMDVNFDGYNDLCVLYRRTGLNSYYMCWIWDLPTKSFHYYIPFAELANPVANKDAKTITSYNKSSTNSVSVVTYAWENGEISLISHEMLNAGDNLVTGAEDVDSAIAVFDGIAQPVVSLCGNHNSSSSWICKIEDESIVKLNSQKYDELTYEYSFTFQGVTAGTTTVVFRYAKAWDTDYIAEKIINITVNPDMTVKINVIE